jgi:hypothetical protein
MSETNFPLMSETALPSIPETAFSHMPETAFPHMSETASSKCPIIIVSARLRLMQPARTAPREIRKPLSQKGYIYVAYKPVSWANITEPLAPRVRCASHRAPAYRNGGAVGPRTALCPCPGPGASVGSRLPSYLGNRTSSDVGNRQ